MKRNGKRENVFRNFFFFNCLNTMFTVQCQQEGCMCVFWTPYLAKTLLPKCFALEDTSFHEI